MWDKKWIKVSAIRRGEGGGGGGGGPTLYGKCHCLVSAKRLEAC